MSVCEGVNPAAEPNSAALTEPRSKFNTWLEIEQLSTFTCESESAPYVFGLSNQLAAADYLYMQTMEPSRIACLSYLQQTQLLPKAIYFTQPLLNAQPGYPPLQIVSIGWANFQNV
ncbi:MULTISPECIES: hypothetical protein [unclassified Klebsiella]|uniref:hypothetical protein n=1 Tax=unclassified Klebsiella TaxID=2608929 RepID=UPI001D182A57|nr:MULTISPECIES: hypothetical protein [unclassified Klebsiella]